MQRRHHRTRKETHAKPTLNMRKSAQIIEAPNQIPPPAPEAALESGKIIHRHIPRTRLDPLERAKIHINGLRELFLGQFSSEPQPEDVPPDNDMWFDGSLHPVLHAANNAL